MRVFRISLCVLSLGWFFRAPPGWAGQENPAAFHKAADAGYIPFWAPDGTALVYGGTAPSANIFRLSLSDGVTEALTEGGGFHPSVSPDGRYIVYDSRGALGTLLRIAFKDGGPAPLAERSIAGNFSSWSPDGSRLVFDRRGDLWTLDLKSGKERLLFASEMSDSRPCWSPDGRKIAFDSGNPRWQGNVDIYIIDADGTDLTRLTDAPKIDAQPDWSPDGRWIAFMSETGGSRDIWIMRADGSGKRRLTDDPGMDVWPRWSPDGTRIAFGSERQTGEGGGINIWIIELQKQLGPDFFNRNTANEENRP